MKTIRTITEFLASLDESQRRYFLEHLQGAERRIQRAMLDLGRGLSGVSELHGRAVAARFECTTRVDRPSRASRSRAEERNGRS
jgi:hypothetical protein